MRILTYLSFTLLTISACSGKCSGDFNGTYAGSGDTLALDSKCVFGFTASGCSSAGTYGAPLGSSGNVAVVISTVTGSGTCFPAGNYTCAYTLSGANLGIDCGGGVVNLVKQ